MLVAFDRAVQGQYGGDRRLPRQRPTGTSAQAGIRKAAEAGAVTLTSPCAVAPQQPRTSGISMPPHRKRTWHRELHRCTLSSSPPSPSLGPLGRRIPPS